MRKTISIKQLLMWVSEAQTIHEGWRKDSWEDYEFRDGQQWNEATLAAMKLKGINPLTINRTFPIINLVHGHFINNQQDIVAKGRTKEDSELAQVMGESISYVRDQNLGSMRVQKAFNEQITTGIGFMGVGLNPDPRQEVVKWSSYPWYSIWWDPYASPWLDKDECRYCFNASWKDLENVIKVFPDKKTDIMEAYSALSVDTFVPDVYDEGTEVEEFKQFLSSGNWVNTERKRVRPVEMWYTRIEKAWFALMPDGRVFDLDKLCDCSEQYQIIQAANEVVSANVKKMRVATFLGNLLLQDIPSPYIHDEYPFIPFVGYLDRFDFPFGIPRQIKEQDMEVNKRRSMALSLLSNRRVYIEDGAAVNINKAYEEANRADGFIVMKKNKMDRIKIQEMGELAPAQIDLMHQSENEIKEISGANDESLGYETRIQSGVALERKQQQSATVTANLLANVRESQKRLGELTMSLVQNRWTQEKVLRIVDRVTGSEKFVAINQKVYNPESGAIEVKNNLPQGRFDIVIANRPMTDTVREKNMDLIFSAINKSPQEAVGPLLNLALELSDIPNKDELLKQVRAATGVSPIDDNLSMAEREEKERQEAEAVKLQQAEDRELQVANEAAELDAKKAKVEKTKAETEEIRSNIGTEKQVADQKGYEAGHKMGLELLKAKEPTSERKTSQMVQATGAA